MLIIYNYLLNTRDSLQFIIVSVSSGPLATTGVFLPMMKRHILALLAACGIAAACAPTLPPNQPIREVKWLNQNWNTGERFWFHHATQGTSTFPIPYKWFVSLEQPVLLFDGPPPMLVDPEYMRRFGFIPSMKTLPAGEAAYGGTPYEAAEKTQDARKTLASYSQTPEEVNPDGLPVGFAKTRAYVDPSTGQPVPDQIGLSCAACHTGHLEYKGVSVRFDGGPALTDLSKFQDAFGLALAFTAKLPSRFDRFAVRVLGPDATAAQKQELKTALNTLVEKGAQLASAIKPVTDQNVSEGFFRLDALTRIGNTVFAEGMVGAPDFNSLQNEAPIVAPVSYPYTWDTSWFVWVQYDGSIMQPMIRNAGEALGVGAKINTTNPSRKLYESSVQADTIHEMEMLLAGHDPLRRDPKNRKQVVGFNGLQSPKWPQEVLGAIDPAKAAEGRKLYKDLCQDCHLPPVDEKEFWTAQYWKTLQEVGYQGTQVSTGKGDRKRLQRYLDVKVLNVGTDPAQYTILQTRKVKLPAYLDVKNVKLFPECTVDVSGPTQTDTLFAVALGYVVQKTADTWYEKHDTPPAKQQEMNGYRPNCLQAPSGYKARPLNGIWATAPFLHNGSVPTLDALLSPASERPKKFCTGLREFDPVRIGYSTECVSGTTELDTTVSGSTNVGHEFKDAPLGNGVIGRALSPKEREALIAFLKSI